MEIIEAAEKHIPEITKLWMEFMYFNSEIEPYDTNGENVLTQVETHLKNMIDSEDSLLLVAIEDECVVGYSISSVTLRPSLFKGRDIGHIYDIAITTAHRGKGIGRRMLDRIKTWFESKNVDRIELSDITRKTVPDSFWKEQGFKEALVYYLEN